ncbi:calmodulin-lysine N-methyltransferase isoform X2 [Gastrolobium bilobum]|uniref:calmodulin-lysine N-methyltransferase isoform X2 n=1 Tax=Gastrolobium bilobum TaxID=150636 RepID=UPI002AB072A4|nr:calmodulin-lysine N-methyltransferase isoform X2 [Gastrolobium bilobum]
MENRTNEKASSLRWKILRQALLSHPSPSNELSQRGIKRISRRTSHGFNLIPSHVIEDERGSNKCDGSSTSTRDARVCYTLPIPGAPQLFLTQRVDNRADLSDFEICDRYNIDNTGLVCNWPSEDVLAHYCLSHADIFRSKKVIELGSGYGLAGFVIAAVTEASEVVMSDGNPQVVDYTQRNIEANSGAFGDTIVKSMMLHWNQEDTFKDADTFDIIVASDCTFFKDFHRGLARIVKHLLSKAGSSEAIFLCPKRGNSLDLFLEVAEENSLHFSVTENYDKDVWKRHEGFLNGEDRDCWPSYEKGHCYPLLIRITL